MRSCRRKEFSSGRQIYDKQSRAADKIDSGETLINRITGSDDGGPKTGGGEKPPPPA